MFFLFDFYIIWSKLPTTTGFTITSVIYNTEAIKMYTLSSETNIDLIQFCFVGHCKPDSARNSWNSFDQKKAEKRQNPN